MNNKENEALKVAQKAASTTSYAVEAYLDRTFSGPSLAYLKASEDGSFAVDKSFKAAYAKALKEGELN